MRHFLFFLFQLLQLFLFGFRFIIKIESELWSVDYTEANIIFSDDTGIETIEVKQQNIVRVKSLFGLEHHASLILLLALIFLIVLPLFFPELVGNNQVPFFTFVHDEELVSLGSLIFQAPLPQVATDVT